MFRRLGRVCARWLQRGEAQTRTAILLCVLSAAGIVTIAQREVYVAKPYKDGAGVLTNGYGNTHNVKPTSIVTPERALVDLLKNTNEEAAGVRACVTAPLFSYEFDVYVLLAHNVGVPTVCRHSPKPATNPYLIDLINAGRYQEACDRILAFNKITDPKTGQKIFSQGLANARVKDRLRCLGKDVPL
jgi:lysozyme